MLAGTRERFDWLKMAQARGRYLGMELELISADEAARVFPIIDKKLIRSSSPPAKAECARSEVTADRSWPVR